MGSSAGASSVPVNLCFWDLLRQPFARTTIWRFWMLDAAPAYSVKGSISNSEICTLVSHFKSTRSSLINIDEGLSET